MLKKNNSGFNRHIIVNIIIAILLFTLPLIIINILFKMKTDIWFLKAEWSAGEVLSYIGGFEALLGTIILGVVAIKQNNKANDINDRLLKMEEESRRFRIEEKAAPVQLIPQKIDKSKKFYVIVDDNESGEYDEFNQKYLYFSFLDSPLIKRENKRTFNMVIKIENISNSVIKKIRIDNFKLYDIFTNSSEVSVEKQNIREYHYVGYNQDNSVQCMVRPGDFKEICLKIGMDDYNLSSESFNINFNLSTFSIYNVKYSVNINLQRNNNIDAEDRVYETEGKSSFENIPEMVYDKERL